MQKAMKVLGLLPGRKIFLSPGLKDKFGIGLIDDKTQKTTMNDVYIIFSTIFRSFTL